MNLQSYALLGAVATCLPSDEELGKTYELEHFFRSSDYRALVSEAAVKRYLPEVLDQKRIRTCSSNELHQLAELMKSLHAFFHSLEQGIQKGCLPKWQPEHRPDLMDKESLNQRTKQLKSYGECVSIYTNIRPQNCMDIFEPSTVRSVPYDLLMTLKPKVSGGQEWGNLLAETFVGKTYCISQESLPSRWDIRTEEQEKEKDENDVAIAQALGIFSAVVFAGFDFLVFDGKHIHYWSFTIIYAITALIYLFIIKR